MDDRDDEAGLLRPVMRHDTAELGPDASFEALHAAARDAYDIRPETGQPYRIDLSLTGWSLESVLFTEIHCWPQGNFLDDVRVARHAKRTPRDYVRVFIARAGSTRMRFDDHDVFLDTGAVHLIDHARTWVRRFGDRYGERDHFGAFVPSDLIGYDRDRHPPHMRFDLQSGPGQMLFGSMLAVRESLPTLRTAEAPNLGSGFTGLLRGLIAGGWQSQDDATMQDTRAAAMRKHLDRHLRDPDVGLATLAAAFGASRATIYRDFAADGGVERYIQRRRLEGAYRDLTGQPPRRGAVIAAAESWGFVSIHHFSRAFRAEYGMPPSEAVGLWYMPPHPDGTVDARDQPSDGYSLQTWLSRL